ncbi:UNVERIFIED_CONTAM: hypothetical protein HDU68_006617, partial [Siphonaria sp. JEL0065]
MSTRPSLDIPRPVLKGHASTNTMNTTRMDSAPSDPPMTAKLEDLLNALSTNEFRDTNSGDSFDDNDL